MPDLDASLGISVRIEESPCYLIFQAFQENMGSAPLPLSRMGRYP
jgi:hypothetical protein